MIYSVDRFEGAYAILVGEMASDVPVLLSDLPEGIQAGDVLKLQDGIYVLDPAEQQKRRERILALQDKLRRK